MFTVLENLGKLGLGGLFGGAVAHVLLLFFQFSYADGTPVDNENLLLCGAFFGASLGRVVDKLLFDPMVGSKRRRILIEEIRAQRLPVELRNELISKVYIEDMSNR
ncbi:MAG: hypothetical protein Kilf2KO_28440 [Rhodospirillales bacterium]